MRNILLVFAVALLCAGCSSMKQVKRSEIEKSRPQPRGVTIVSWEF